MTRGFTLVELLVAFLILQVGLLATAGMVLQAQRILREAELTARGALEAGAVADSLLRSGPAEDGSLLRPWGEILWRTLPGPPGGVVVWSVTPGGLDTLATLTVWTPVERALAGGEG